jgi:hypothetical protein
MRQEPTGQPRQEACVEFEQQLILYAADELERGESAVLEAHLEHCTACAAALERERRLLEMVTAAGSAEPSADLLASCRDALDEALDELTETKQPSRLARWADAFFPGHWFALHPVWSAALFIIIGFSVGTLAPRLMRQQPSSPETTNLAGRVAPVAAVTANDQDIRTADVAGINWTPAGENEPPRVEVQLSTERPVLVQGTVDSSNVKKVLLNILNSKDRFSPDLRLDAVELLKLRNNDPAVRQALCNAVRTDHNAAVRLKALEALNSAEPQDIIRQTLIGALVDDANPGVRIEAINTLRALAEQGAVSSDAQLLEVLRERQRKDPNAYVRLQSASVIHELGPREKY